MAWLSATSRYLGRALAALILALEASIVLTVLNGEGGASGNGGWSMPRPPLQRSGPDSVQCGEAEPLRFFIYDLPFFRSCRPAAYNTSSWREMIHQADEFVQFFGPDVFLRQQLEDHPWRTRDPKVADLFVVPAPMSMMKSSLCGPSKRYLSVLTRRLLSSEWYQRYQGADHLLINTDWRNLGDLYSGRSPFFRATRNFIIGDYMSRNYGKLGSVLRRKSRRCLVPVPYNSFWGLSNCNVSAEAGGRLMCPPAGTEASFEEYKAARDFSFLFMGNTRRGDRFRRAGGKSTREVLLDHADELPGANVIVSSTDAELPVCNETERQLTGCRLAQLNPSGGGDYGKAFCERYIRRSRFALHLAGRDVLSSRIFDSLTFGTPQIFVNSWFYPGAYFKCEVDWSSMVAYADEVEFRADAVAVMRRVLERITGIGGEEGGGGGGRDGSEVWAKIWAAQRKAADDLLWHTPDSRVAHNILLEVSRHCLPGLRAMKAAGLPVDKSALRFREVPHSHSIAPHRV